MQSVWITVRGGTNQQVSFELFYDPLRIPTHSWAFGSLFCSMQHFYGKQCISIIDIVNYIINSYDSTIVEIHITRMDVVPNYRVIMTIQS